MTEPDMINNPHHYKSHPSGIECIQIVEHLPFNLGNAVKYMFRCDHKHPEPVLDLKKALWYINRDERRMENLPSGQEIRGVELWQSEESVNDEYQNTCADKEWIFDRHVFLSSYSPIFTQNGFRNFQRELSTEYGSISPKWRQKEQYDNQFKMGNEKAEFKQKNRTQYHVSRSQKSCCQVDDSRGERHKIEELDRVFFARDWRDIQCISNHNLSYLEKCVLDISKFVGLNDDLVTRAVFYVWRSYIWRSDEKGNTIQDLKKAAWYIQREIERLEKEAEFNTPTLHFIITKKD